MKSLKLLFVAICISVSPLIAQTNQPKQIEVIGYGAVSVFPNAASITLKIKFTRPTLREAVNETQKTETEVLKIIRDYVSDSSEIMIGFISTDKSYSWNTKLQKDIFNGFESQMNIVFPLKNLSRMEKFTEAILKTRIQEIEGISYYNTDADVHFKKAQDLAIKDALESITRIALISNVKVGNIININTDSSPNLAKSISSNTSTFNTYGKGMGGRGVSASGQVITYSTKINILSEIL